MFLTVDSENFQNKSEGILATYGIRSFPTFTFHIDRAEVERMVGANPTKLDETVRRLEESMEDKRLEAALYLSTTQSSAKEEATDDNSKSNPNAAPVETIALKLKRVTGELFQVSVDKAGNVGDLKAAVAAEQKIAVDAQKLIFKGKLLKNEQTLEECGLNEEGLTVHLAVKSGTGAASKQSGTATTGSASGATATAASGNFSENRHTEERRRLRTALTTLVTANGREKARAALLVMLLYVRNIQSHPGEPKYRSIRKKNAKYVSTIGKCQGADEVMRCLGFKEEKRNNDELFWVFGIMDLPPLRREIDDTLRRLAPNVTPPTGTNERTTSTFGSAPNPPPAMGNPFAGFNPFLQQPLGGSAQPPANSLFSPEIIQNMMSNPAVQNMMQNMQRSGGLPDLSAMMNDENVQAMMQNMMSQPGFAQMMSNPDLLNSLSGLGAGMNSGAFNFDPSMLASMMQPNQPSTGQSAPQQNSQGGNGGSRNSSAGGSPNGQGSNTNAGDEDEDDLSDLDDIYTN